MKEYGKTVRIIRQNKQLLQKEVYENLVVKSFAIRFEKGEVMLQYDTFLEVLNRLNVTPDEFHFIHNDYKMIEEKTVWSELILAISTGNDRKLHSIYQSYKDSKVIFERVLAFLANAIDCYNPQRSDPHAGLDKNEVKAVYNYFKGQDRWTLDEITIFTTCHYIFTSLEQQRLLKRCYPSLRLYRGYPLYNEGMVTLLSHYILDCYHKGEIKEANAWFVKLKSIPTTKDELSLRLRQLLCEAYYCYAKGQKSEAEQLIKNQLFILETLGLENEAEGISRSYKRFKENN